MFDENLSQWGYNTSTGKFDLSSGAFAKACALEKELMSIPGLAADSLVNTKLREEGKEDDYIKKFGKNLNPFMDGNILCAFVGSWDLDWMKQHLTMIFILYQ